MITEKLLIIQTVIDKIPDSIKERVSDIFKNMIDTVISLPSRIREFIVDFRDTVVQLFDKLPEIIMDAIKRVFIPEDGFIESKIEHFRDKLLEMGIDTYNMGAIFNSEQPFTDITCSVRGQEVTIVRMDVVDKVVKKFRPVIRGFMWLMLVFYNFNQFMGFIGQKGMTLGGIIHTADAEGKKEWYEKV